MYEKLEKIRTELAKARKRREEAEIREKRLVEKLREAEGEQILADVAAFQLTPEELVELLKMTRKGSFPARGIPLPVEANQKEEEEKEVCEDDK